MRNRTSRVSDECTIIRGSKSKLLRRNVIAPNATARNRKKVFPNGTESVNSSRMTKRLECVFGEVCIHKGGGGQLTAANIIEPNAIQVDGLQIQSIKTECTEILLTGTFCCCDQLVNGSSALMICRSISQNLQRPFQQGAFFVLHSFFSGQIETFQGDFS